MPRDAAFVWIVSTGFYAARWRMWLAEREAPDLSRWAETREGRDPLRDVPAVEYCVPSLMPPAKVNHKARREVFDLIRRRCETMKRVA